VTCIQYRMCITLQQNVHRIQIKALDGPADKLWQTSLYCGTNTVALHRLYYRLVSRLEVQQQVFSSAITSCVEDNTDVQGTEVTEHSPRHYFGDMFIVHYLL